MKNETIIHMRVHQAVNFEKCLVSYFSNVGAPGKSKAKMTILDSQCVLVEGPTDRVLVPFVNVAFMKLESKAALKKIKDDEREAAKPKSTLKSQDIKRPR